MSHNIPLVADLGPGKTGLTVTYTVYRLDKTTVESTGTLTEEGTTGIYTIAGGALSHDDGGYWQVTATGIEKWGTYAVNPMSSGVGDWTATEREGIRYRLGVDGTATAPATNTPDLAQKSDLTNLDVAVSSRSNHSAADVWVSPTREVTGGTVDNVTNAVTTDAASRTASQADVSAIQAKTDQLTFTVANQVDANALSGGFAAADRTKLDEVYTFRRLDAAKPLTTDRNGDITTETDGTITITHTVNPTTETVTSQRTG